MRGGSARQGSFVAGAGAAVMVALAVVTNYVTTSLPGWAEDPRLVWGVFGGLAVIALVLQLWGRRLDTDQGGASGGRPVAVSRIVSDAAESLRPPSIDRPVRGREATISDLQRLLRRSRVANRIAVVTGTGGMGKTTVAAAMAKKAQEKGTPVFWIPALNASELAEHMVRVAVACGLQEEALESARAGRVSLADAVWEQLAKTKRWLIVLDNLDDPDIARSGSGPLHDHRGWVRCPEPGGLLLITSRVADGGTWGAGTTVMRLAPLPDHDGAQVLLDGAPQAGSQAEAELLARRLGGLPLALRAAAKYVAAPSSRHHTLRATAELSERNSRPSSELKARRRPTLKQRARLSGIRGIYLWIISQTTAFSSPVRCSDCCLFLPGGLCPSHLSPPSLSRRRLACRPLSPAWMPPSMACPSMLCWKCPLMRAEPPYQGSSPCTRWSVRLRPLI
ncbi:hypothetical protein SPURM210S_07620 [Streptomyces purpurascens]